MVDSYLPVWSVSIRPLILCFPTDTESGCVGDIPSRVRTSFNGSRVAGNPAETAGPP